MNYARAVVAFAILLLTGLPLHAQQQPPGTATPDAPPQTGIRQDAPLNPALPTIFIVGDSTARNSADLGWGDHFAQFFATAKVNVANRARAGRSSRTYINEGLWSAVLAEMKPGDYVLLQMGHNDSGDLDGAKPRGSLKGIGEETRELPQTTGPLAGKTETIHTYGWYTRKYISETRAKGAHPILLTTTIRNIWKDGRIERDMGYDGYIREIAAAEHVPVADMSDVEADQIEALGQERTAALFPKDHTHTSAAGAELVAAAVARSLREIHSPLDQFMLPVAPAPPAR